MRHVLALVLLMSATMLAAQTSPINRETARNSGAKSPAVSHKRLSRQPAETLSRLVNVGLPEVYDQHAGMNELHKIEGAFNQIGVPFEMDFRASRDFPKQLKKARGVHSWATPISSEGALGLRLELDLTGLDADDRIYLVDAYTNHSLGPFTAENGVFWGPLVEGDTTIVMLESADDHFGEVMVQRGSHLYKAAFKAGAKVCEDDLNCENATIRNIAEAVGQYSFVKSGSTFVCTGTLLNATDNSFTPYFLTANHCVSTSAVASTVHVYWDYRSTSCNSGVGVSKSGLPQSINATLLATNGNLDATLLQLPNSGGSRHFMGWNATSAATTGQSVTCIHHPAGDYMRVSKGTITGVNQTACNGSYTNEIRVDWIDSLTEGGSSGSAILNSNYEVIGDESGCGPENCNGTSAPGNYDWYGSFYHFYPQISQYLDPSPGGGTPELQNGVTVSNISLAKNATAEFTINIPANASNLEVEISGTGDADLYVKRAAINWPGDQGSHNDAEFKAPYNSGSNESVTFATPAADTWNVLIHGYDPSTVSITATWTVSSGSAQWNYVSWVRQTPHNYGNNQTYTYTYSSSGATSVAVHFTTLNTEANYDFVRVYDQNNNLVFEEDGNLISNGSGSAFGRTDGWCVVTGSSMRIEVVTDGSVTRYGILTDQAANYQ